LCFLSRDRIRPKSPALQLQYNSRCTNLSESFTVEMALCIDTHEIRRLYETIDEDGDGRLTVTEMNGYLRRLGMEISGEDLKYLAIPLSQSEDGSLTFDEFVGMRFYLCTLQYR
jgi:Ca2+-binding EF-hand superfamily protein